MVMDTVSAAYRTKTDVFPLDADTLKSLHNLIQIGLHQRLILCAVWLIDWRTSVELYYQYLKPFHETLDKLRIRHIYYGSPGTSHDEWLTWRRHLHEFAPRLFR